MKKVIYITLLILVLIGQAIIIDMVLSENKRLNQNMNTLHSRVEYYQTSDSLQAARVSALELDRKEIREYYQKTILDNLNSMNIRLRRLEAYASVSTRSEYHLKAFLRDSIEIRLSNDSIVYDTIPVKYIDYKSPWVDFYQLQIGNTTETRINTRDSLTIVQHKQPYPFWSFKWFKTQHKLDVKNSNPHSEITHAFYVKHFKRRKR